MRWFSHTSLLNFSSSFLPFFLSSFILVIVFFFSVSLLSISPAAVTFSTHWLQSGQFVGIISLQDIVLDLVWRPEEKSKVTFHPSPSPPFPFSFLPPFSPCPPTPTHPSLLYPPIYLLHPVPLSPSFADSSSSLQVFLAKWEMSLHWERKRSSCGSSKPLNLLVDALVLIISSFKLLFHVFPLFLFYVHPLSLTHSLSHTHTLSSPQSLSQTAYIAPSSHNPKIHHEQRSIECSRKVISLGSFRNINLTLFDCSLRSPPPLFFFQLVLYLLALSPFIHPCFSISLVSSSSPFLLIILSLFFSH